MMSQRIIDVLNKDPKAIEFKKEYEKQMDKYQLSDEEKQEKRKLMMMLCIYNNDEAKSIMKQQIYNDLKAQ